MRARNPPAHDPVRPTELLAAWWLLGWMRFALAARPLARILAGCRCLPGTPEPPVRATGEQRRVAVRLSRSVALAARCAPFNSGCLVRALALQRMLAVRGIPGQLCIGVRLGQEDQPAGSLGAHAWLRCGPRLPGSERPLRGYSPICTFHWPAQR